MDFVVVLIVAGIVAALVLGVISPRLVRPKADTFPTDVGPDSALRHDDNVREQARSVKEETEELSSSER